MSSRNNKLYNYLVNTFGLSKPVIMEHAEARINDIVGKNLADKIDSKYMQKLILDRITHLIENGMSTGWYSRDSFEDYVKKVVQEAIEDKVNNEYTIEVKLVRKDKTVMGKS